MLLRILLTEAQGVRTLRVEGRLAWDGLDELRRAYADCAGPVELDLADLREADAVGTAYLQGLVQAGARVRRASPYVAALLWMSGRPDRSQ